jgi:hypothetical protein
VGVLPYDLLLCFEAFCLVGSAPEIENQAALQCESDRKQLWQAVGTVRGVLAPAWMSSLLSMHRYRSSFSAGALRVC